MADYEQTERTLFPDGDFEDGAMGVYVAQGYEEQVSSEAFVEEIDKRRRVRVDSEAQVNRSLNDDREVRHVHVNRRSIPERLKRMAVVSTFAAGALVAALVAKEVVDFWPSFEAKEKAKLVVGPAESTIRENSYINLAEIQSKFPMELRTSLDRPGPVNCDMNIDMTNEDEQVMTTSNTGLILEEYEVKETEEGYQIDVSGEMEMTPVAVNWLQSPILFEEKLVWSDRCMDMNEPNQAMDIAVTTAIAAGRLAAVCAIDSEEGEKAIRNGIITDAIRHDDIDPEVNYDSVKVIFHNLAEQQDAHYGRAVREFDHVVGAKLEEYLSNDNHKAETNFDGIKDCEEHTFTFEEN